MTKNMLNVLALIHFGVDVVAETYPARAAHRRHLLGRFIADGFVRRSHNGPTLTERGLNLLKHATKELSK